MRSLGGTASDIAARFRRIAETVLLLLENRLELLSLELREEKLELVRIFVRALLAVHLSMLALVLACISIVMLCPPQWRPLALLAVTGGAALLALVAVLLLTRSVKRLGKPLSRTIEEFRRDRSLL